MNESRRARKFEVVKSFEVEEQPDVEIKVYAQNEIEMGEEATRRLVDDYISGARKAARVAEGVRSRKLDFFLPGRIARQEGMPSSYTHEERTDFKKALLAQIDYDLRGSDRSEAEVRVMRMLDNRVEFVKELAEKAKEIIDEYQGLVDYYLVDFVESRLGADQAEIRVVQERLQQIFGIVILDPLFDSLDRDGGFNTVSRVVSVNALTDTPLHSYVHEMLHAIQTQFTLINSDYIRGEAFFPEFKQLRTGVRMPDDGEGNRLNSLNEAITENAAVHIYNRIVEDHMEGRSVDGRYKDERNLMQDLIDFVYDEVSERDALELRDLMYQAAFLDDVNSEKGRAFYFRKLSKKMRELFGDGALVAIDNEMDRLLTELKEVDPESVDDTLESFKNFLASRLRK